MEVAGSGSRANGYPAEVRVVDGQEICVHEHDLPASDVTTVGGIRVTTALRTIIDIADDGPAGDRARVALRPHALTAPELIDLEVLSALRGQAQVGKVPARRAELARQDLVALPLDRVPHRPLLACCWELRANLTPYDAAYVALAALLDVDLVTADARLARASGVRCRVEVVSSDEPV